MNASTYATVLFFALALMAAPATATTATVDADPSDGDVGVTTDDPEEEESGQGCDPHCATLPLSSDVPNEEATLTVDTDQGAVTATASTDGEAPLEVTLDPEEEEEPGCSPHCATLPLSSGAPSEEATLTVDTDQGPVVVTASTDGDAPLEVTLFDDPEEEEEEGSPCRPHC